jgi:hypothetical protein
MKHSSWLAAVGLAGTLLFIFWWDSRLPEAIMLVPTLTGEAEYCLTCHDDLPEISPSHPVETFGCIICHGGEALALEADLAHSSMRGADNPSRLDIAQESCGGSECHSGEAENNRDHVQRVQSSIQSTYAGAIASIRYTFGAQSDLQAQMAIFAVQDHDGISQTGIMSLDQFDPISDQNPSITAFAENCLTCHLSADPISESAFQRYSGCSACHTPTNGEEIEKTQIHRLTTAIPYTQCNTCHNRGNYDLRAMQFISRSDRPTDRLNDYYQPIAQFVRCEWTLDCIDCHTRYEAMGDGDIYNNQAEIQYVQCKTCHGTLLELPKTRALVDQNDLAFTLAFLNPVIDLKIGDHILITERDEVLWNARSIGDRVYELIGKATGERFTFKSVMGSGCLQNPDEQESRYCHVCHAVER